MGNQINAIGFRLGPVYTWSSRWFAPTAKYKNLVLEDAKIRKALMSKLKSAGIARVEIERSINRIGLIIFVSRPGVVIGRGGSGMEDLKKYVTTKLLVVSKDDKNAPKIDLRVEAIKEPNLDAHLVAVNIADQLAKRMPAKRILKQSAEKVMTAGAKGVKIHLGGRINGAEIARKEKIQLGVVPLSSIKERIDYCTYPAYTRSGYIGVKVWICTFPENKVVESVQNQPASV